MLAIASTTITCPMLKSIKTADCFRESEDDNQLKIRQTKDQFNIGKNVRALRLERGLTQEQTVAKMQLLGISISRGTYSHIECGIANIKVQELLALCEIFQVQPGNFFIGLTL